MLNSFGQMFRIVLRKRILCLSSVLCFAFASAVFLGAGRVAYELFFTSLPGLHGSGFVNLARVSPEGQFRSFSFPEFKSLLVSRSVALGLFTDPIPVPIEDGNDTFGRITVQYTSHDLLRVLGSRPILGTGDLRRTGDEYTAVISYNFWRSQFQLRSDVLGRRIAIAGMLYTVIGVVDPSYVGPVKGLATDAWLDLNAMDRTCLNKLGCRTFRIMGRLRDHASTTQAEAELTTLLHNANPFERALIRVSGARAGFLPVDPATQRRFVFLFCLAAVVFVLAILNVTILLLSARGARIREIAVRIAVGAQEQALVRLFLLEAVFIVGSGIVLGAVLSEAVSRMMRGFLAGSMPIALGSANPLIPLAAVTLIFIGVGPYAVLAVYEVRQIIVSEALKIASRTTTQSLAEKRLARRLIAVQIVLTVVLLSSAVTFSLRLAQLARVQTGFETDRLEFVSVVLPPKEQPRSPRLFAAFAAHLASVPGVDQSAVIAPSPLQGSAWVVRAADTSASRSLDSLLFVGSPNTLDALGVPLVIGSGFDGIGNRSDVAIVSRTFAHRLWRDEPCIGRFIDTIEAGRLEVVGEVPDLLLTDIREPISPVLFVPIGNRVATQARFSLLLRTHPGRPIPVHTLSAIAHQTPTGIAIDRVETGRKRVGIAIAQIRIIAELATVFAVLASAVVGIGVYANFRSALRHRTLEIGIRLALGDNPFHLRWRLVRENGSLIVAAVAIGIGAAMFTGDGIGSALYGVGIDSRFSALIAGFFTAAIAFAASYFPVCESTSVDLQDALRQE